MTYICFCFHASFNHTPILKLAGLFLFFLIMPKSEVTGASVGCSLKRSAGILSHIAFQLDGDQRVGKASGIRRRARRIRVTRQNKEVAEPRGEKYSGEKRRRWRPVSAERWGAGRAPAGGWHGVRSGWKGNIWPCYSGPRAGRPLLPQVSPTLPFKTRAALSTDASVFGSSLGSDRSICSST